MTRRFLIFGVALFAAAIGATPASAAAPAGQRAQLTAGTAVLRFSEATDRERLGQALKRLPITVNFFEALPMVAARGPENALRSAARVPGVVAAHANRRLGFELYQATPLVFGGQHEEMATAGFDGRGVNVAVVDSGVNGLHADLSDHMVENFEVVDPGSGPVVQECPLPANTCDTDENGHGSHVAGIATGDGSSSEGFHRGIASGSGLVGYSVGVGPTILFAVAAYDHILAHPELGVVAVNSSFGESGGGRFDSTNPINQATKRLKEAGVVVVFSNGNSGTNADGAPPGSSDCATGAADGLCKTNPYSVAPWVLSAAGGRKDMMAPPSDQHLSLYSARGDDTPQQAVSGETIDYSPTLTAPGTNVRSVRDPSGDAQFTNPANDPSSAAAPPGGATYEASYVPLTGTSMAAPALTGAVAVVQSAAKARLGRLLTFAEVERVMTESAQPMTGNDGLWDFPCDDGAGLIQCGSANPGSGFTGQPYAKWQVGAGYLDVVAAVGAVQAMPVPPGDGPPGDNPPVGPGAPVACADRLLPTAGLGRARLRLKRRVLAIRGSATDRGCGAAGVGSVRNVRLAVGRGVGRGRCRFVGARGSLGRVRSCRRRQYLPARGATAWRLALKRPPKGPYLIWALATDSAGNAGPLEGPRRLRVRP